jgi:hypothetical protein
VQFNIDLFISFAAVVFIDGWVALTAVTTTPSTRSNNNQTESTPPKIRG